MFDVGFSELVLIALVALVVIGPERLPKVARTVGVLLGRLQRYVNDVKSDINREIQLDELKKFRDEVSNQAREMQDSMTSDMRAVEDSLNRSIAMPEEASTLSHDDAQKSAALADPIARVPEQQLELGLDPKPEKNSGHV